MRVFQAVTTFSLDGWLAYGERMVRSFDKFWPDAVQLVVYVDASCMDVMPRISSRVIWRSLEEIPWLRAFKAEHADPKFRGMRGGTYDYRFDACKFVHKPAVVEVASKKACRDGVTDLIWLDGDITTHSPLTAGALVDILPASYWMAWLDRDWPPYPEAGVLAFEVWSSPAPIIGRWADLYRDGAIFLLTEWHDAFALKYVAERDLGTVWLQSGVLSLSGDVGRATSHPLVNGPLGAWLDHLKGPRKSEGRSRPRDLVRPRPEPYWQEAPP